MKICIISFDIWNYNQYIVEALVKKGIDACHINTGAFTHANLREKVINAFSKVFLRKNLKYEKRQNLVIESLKSLGKQDQILILNPDTFDISTIETAKRYTTCLITYLYDNIDRYPVKDKLCFFDKIFSFDDSDVKKYGFEKITNYIYCPYLAAESQSPSIDLSYITSYDKKRLKQIDILRKELSKKKVRFQFNIVGKKSWKRKLKNRLFPSKDTSITFKTKRIQHKNVVESYKNTKAILELMREGQDGLSFRIFEALALEKKIVTDNEKIKNYDFYMPNNILVLNKDMTNVNADFFQIPYHSLPEEIYNKYNLDYWLFKVFNLPLT